MFPVCTRAVFTAAGIVSPATPGFGRPWTQPIAEAAGAFAVPRPVARRSAALAAILEPVGPGSCPAFLPARARIGPGSAPVVGALGTLLGGAEADAAMGLGSGCLRARLQALHQDAALTGLDRADALAAALGRRFAR
ncbi:hypothetical protein MMMDOFMJ_1447 [Methylobacterium gnaphalii]|nr:hypothetical protein MMMDOFMJ_1447 [Methylobacterium gnaphalii]